MVDATLAPVDTIETVQTVVSDGTAVLSGMATQRILTTELAKHAGQRVKLMGWMQRLRKLGDVNFLVLRDRAGLAQAVLSAAELEPLEGYQSETVISLEGDVV